MVISMSETLLEVRNAKKHFAQTDDPFIRALGLEDDQSVRAVDGVTLTIDDGETMGLVGESGCGKSTLGRTILGLHEPTDGEIFYRGRSMSDFSKSEKQELRRNVQVIFQDPADSLDPRMRVGETIREPLDVHDVGDSAERDEKVRDLLEQVGLSASDADRYPHQFSGGQQQRIGIARALALDPDLIIADEPVSSLDMSEQSRVLNLLDRLQRERDISYLFIAHDLNVVRHICDYVGVMYLGKLMEVATTEELFEQPRHPYTEALLSAIPPADPDEPWDPIALDESSIPDPSNPPTGCNFCTRCPIAEDRCFEKEPALQSVTDESPRQSACFFPEWADR